MGTASKSVPKKASGDKPLLRILFIEDVLADVELVVRELEKAGFDVSVDLVQDSQGFLDKLAGNSYDVVLADFNLPQWRGTEALDILKQQGRDIPFILVTGTLGDELAVDCIKQGAADYVLKDRLARLPSAVRRALEEKALHREQARTEQRLREVVQDLDAIVWEADAESWQFSLVSQRAENILGYPVSQWLTEPNFWVNHIHPDDRERTAALCRQASAQGQGHALEYRMVAADGRAVWLADQVRVANEPNGNHRQLHGVMVDITERKRAEEDRLRTLSLEAENKALMRADQMKSEFLADMSHEFRTPLNSILGFSELLLETCQNLAPKQQEDLRLIHQSAQTLLNLVNDSLDLARIEAGHVTLECDLVPVNDTFSRLLDVFSPRFQERKLKACVEVRPPNLAVYADGRRLEQILTNLVGNALKFTARGGITLRAHSGEDGVLFSVEDTGIGIAADALPHVFDKFYQVRQQAGGASRGTGLGLAITKKLVELHGGRLWAESTPGKGTTVSFLLPGEEAARRVPAKEQGHVASTHRTGG